MHESQSMGSLSDIVNISDSERGKAWEIQFFQALTSGDVEVMIAEPQTGPDGWPYLLVQTSSTSQEPESFQKILHWILDKGIGLVINPQKEYPDYVFSYGMLWHFKETGLFFKEQSPKGEGVFEFQVKDIQSAGEPATSYLPSYVRKVMREFFLQQGVLIPKVLAFTLDGEHFELAFSVESLGCSDSSEYQGILEAISWFLPNHYQIVLLSEKELPIPFVNL